MSWYLSRIRLSRSPAVRVLEAALREPDTGLRRSSQHHMLWSAFATDPNQKRDFLWRAESDGSFLTLSPRLPRDDNELFEPPQCKLFAPELKTGDRLEFQLQVNATRMKRDTGKRVDVVLDAIHAIPKEERAEKRMDLAQEAGLAWLTRQGEKAGFVPHHVSADDYHTETLPRFGNERKRSNRPDFGILDLSGQLEVTDPEAFLAQLVRGFGRAKAFGCGLMLIRRAS
ncbi:type I-E CRISPR-associated protein Cas6/Cse3/CasE [Bombella apis]|uniref:type I-E CRISPR-associated protein Cas6/Cse3/CasE n=1 Tax=Bombella apis TaxID=1785988 RepID=UPI000A383D16|nr:type I-E CRISPR-associated protein Cas6/Cse3/CasE [Bombella apis]